MRHTLKPKRLSLAIAGALTCMATGGFSADFDPSSPTVTQAYVGPATPEKLLSASTGLNDLLKELPKLSLGGSYALSLSVEGFAGFEEWSIRKKAMLQDSIFAGSDADLGSAGAPVML